MGQVETLTAQGSGAPTGCRSQLQGCLRVAVLATGHCQALHVGTGVQQQLPWHREDTSAL